MREEAASLRSQIDKDGSLCYSILKLVIEPAEGGLLIGLLAHQLEVFVGKLSIVTVVMLDPDATQSSESFKCLLGFNRFQ